MHRPAGPREDHHADLQRQPTNRGGKGGGVRRPRPSVHRHRQVRGHQGVLEGQRAAGDPHPALQHSHAQLVRVLQAAVWRRRVPRKRNASRARQAGVRRVGGVHRHAGHVPPRHHPPASVRRSQHDHHDAGVQGDRQGGGRQGFFQRSSRDVSVHLSVQRPQLLRVRPDQEGDPGRGDGADRGGRVVHRHHARVRHVLPVGYHPATDAAQELKLLLHRRRGQGYFGARRRQGVVPGVPSQRHQERPEQVRAAHHL